MSITIVLITDYKHIIGKKKRIKYFVIENSEQAAFSRWAKKHKNPSNARA